MSREAPKSERWLSHVPFALIEHPFAVFNAVWGLLAGLPILAGAVKPGSVTDLLPREFVVAWTSMMVLAALSIIWGMIRSRYSTTMARGLQLMGIVWFVWAIAVIAAQGPVQGIPGALLLTLLAGLCSLRGWYLRTQAAIVRRTFAYANGVEQEMARRDLT